MIIDTNISSMLTKLTDRQREVVVLMGRGLTSKEMARELNVSPSAIDQRVHAIKHALRLNRSEIRHLGRRLSTANLTQEEQCQVIDALARTLPGGTNEQGRVSAPALDQASISNGADHRVASAEAVKYRLFELRSVAYFIAGFCAGVSVAMATLSSSLLVFTVLGKSAIRF